MGRCLREKETERQKDGKTRGGTGHGFDPILLQLRKHLSSEANFFSMGKRNSTGQGYRLQRKKKKKNKKANLYYFLGL